MTNNKGTILIADDNDLVRDTLQTFVETLFPDYAPVVFENGDSLASRLEKELVNPSDVKLLITDNDMPGKTGSELIANYANQLSFPIILHYAGRRDIGEEAIKNGAYAYLSKPVKLDFFEEIIGKALKEK